ELLPEPPAQRSEDTPWPLWPMQLRSSAAHEEGGIREWSFMTKKFSGENGQVKKLHGVRVEKITTDSGAIQFLEVPNSDFEIECDLVLLAMGFTGSQKSGLLTNLEIKTNERGNVIVDEHRMTNIEGVFAAGDIKLGASLIVWAIYEGREAAKGIEAYLKKR
ncbi:MAG: FAD-dependent oxidoreductase, partial [Nitrospirota bacterium]|nr:FAD-dependent oxidoreductase [Nitrospirota bacterium]